MYIIKDHATNNIKLTHTVTLDLTAQQEYDVFPITVTLARVSKQDHSLVLDTTLLQFTCIREYVNLCHYRYTVSQLARTRL